jgi:hypothetical protein
MNSLSLTSLHPFRIGLLGYVCFMGYIGLVTAVGKRTHQTYMLEVEQFQGGLVRRRYGLFPSTLCIIDGITTAITLPIAMLIEQIEQRMRSLLF